MSDLLKSSDVGAMIYDRLKTEYLKKIPYGNEFVETVESDDVMIERGMREDHIAFRTFFCKTGDIPPGIESVERIFRACGWSRGVDENGDDYTYDFPNMHLHAIHLEFPVDRPDLPKMFISQIIVDDMKIGHGDRKMIKADLENTKDPLNDEDHKWLNKMEAGEGMPADYAEGFIKRCYKALDRPWEPPHRSTILQTDQRSQYVPWTLLNGGMNHIAYLTNDIYKTAAAHEAAGRELLPNMMGSEDVGLIQTSVRAPHFNFDVTEDGQPSEDGDGKLSFPVREEDGTLGTIRWTGPFAELIQRPLNPDGTRRENFLANNAAHIFAATKNKEA